MSTPPHDLDPPESNQQQDSAIFTALFEQTHLPLLAYAVRRVANPADAADVVADAYLVAWRRIHDVPTGADARPWMFGVARGCLANYYRGERRRTALAERLRHDLERCYVEDHTATDGSNVASALRMLPESDRELMQLAVWEQLSRAEIAIALGCSQAAVRVRLHRARTRLRQAMAQLGRTEPESDPANRPPRSQTLQLVPQGAPRSPSTPTSDQETPCTLN